MENCNLIAEINVAVLVSNIKLSDSDTDFANAPYVSILDLAIDKS